MALAAREVRVAAGDGHVVGVETNVIVDPHSGVAAKVENVAVAVDLGDGNVGVAKRQRIVAVATDAEVSLTYHQAVATVRYSGGTNHDLIPDNNYVHAARAS